MQEDRLPFPEAPSPAGPPEAAPAAPPPEVTAPPPGPPPAGGPPVQGPESQGPFLPKAPFPYAAPPPGMPRPTPPAPPPGYQLPPGPPPGPWPPAPLGGSWIGPPPAPFRGRAPLSAPPVAALPPPARPAGPPPIAVLLGVLLVAAIYLWNSWNRDFWAPEEPDFAAVTKEMTLRAKAGEPHPWIDPKIDGKMYAEKPPLIYWLALLSSWISGSDPRIDYRIPIALAAALGLWLTYIAGRRLFDGRVAGAACLAQASSVLYFQCGSWFITDMLFAVGCSLSVISFGILLLQGPSTRWALLGWTALAMGALSKSALLAPGLVFGPVGIFILLHRKAGILRQFKRLRPLLGASMFLALVLPWYIAMYHLEGWNFIQEHIINQHFARVLEAESHQHGAIFYLGTIWVDFLPWSIFIPLVAFYGWAHFRNPSVRFCAVWALFTFLFFTAFSSKQGKYLLPMWPALCLLGAAALLEEERESIWEDFLGLRLFQGLGWLVRFPLAAVISFGIYWAAGGDLLFFISPFKEQTWYPDAQKILEDSSRFSRFYVLAAMATAAAFAAGVVITRRLRTGEPGRAAACLAGTTIFMYFAFSFLYVDVNQFKSARALGQEVTRLVGDRPLAIYGAVKDRYAIRYYIDRRLDRPPIRLASLDLKGQAPEREEQLDKYLDTPEKVYILFTTKDLDRLLDNFPKYRPRLHRVAMPDGLRFSSRYTGALVTNRDPPAENGG